MCTHSAAVENPILLFTKKWLLCICSGEGYVLLLTLSDIFPGLFSIAIRLKEITSDHGLTNDEIEEIQNNEGDEACMQEILRLSRGKQSSEGMKLLYG